MAYYLKFEKNRVSEGKFVQNFSLSPLYMFKSLWKNRSLILILSKRDVISKYRGSVGGIFWSVINPLFMLSVYTFVFSVVFNARWPGLSSSKIEFALVLFSGLIIFNFFSECIGRAPAIIVSNGNFVKKVVFPVEILPLVLVITSLFHFCISFIVMLVAYFLFNGVPTVTLLISPIIIIPVVFFTAGFTFCFASIGVFLRDINQFIGIALTVFMFMSPIFYSAQALPPAYREVLYLNPLALVIEQFRGMLFMGKQPNWLIFVVQIFVSLVVFWLGYMWFQKTRKGFADVL